MRRKTWSHTLIALTLALFLAACGGGGDNGQPHQQDLSLENIVPQNPSVPQGQVVTLTLTLASQNGFQGEVTFSLLKDGQSQSWLTFSPVSESLNVPKGGRVQVNLQVRVAENAPTGAHNLTVQVVYGNWKLGKEFTLTVTPASAPGFTLRLSPNRVRAYPGSSVETVLTLTPEGGFTGTVNLSLVDDSDNPIPGITLFPTSVQVVGPDPVTQTLTVSVAREVDLGIYLARVKATFGRWVRWVRLYVTVNPPPDFNLQFNPLMTYNVVQGAIFEATITITPRNGFTGTVNLSLVDDSGNPIPGITLSPTSVQVVGPDPVTQTLTVGVARRVASGLYRVKIVGTAGDLSRESFPTDLWVESLELRAVSHGSSGCVAVGWRLAILLSPDCLTWQWWGSRDGDIRDERNLEGVTFGPSGYVAVGDGILLSPDGRTWEVAWEVVGSGATENRLYDVTFGPSGYVAVGDSGSILFSPDGRTWQAVSHEWTFARFRGVTYGPSGYVAVGVAIVLTSTDGRSWQEAPRREIPSRWLEAVTYGPQGYVIVGAATIRLSQDSRNWENFDHQARGYWLYDVTYGPRGYVAVGGDGVILLSPDGRNWRRVGTGVTDTWLEAVTYGPSGYVAVGRNNVILRSPDGENWQIVSEDFTRPLYPP